MNPRLILRLALLMASTGLMGCAASTPQTRIAKNPALFAALTPHQQQRVREGNIENGLPQSAVFLAWGRPHTVSDWNRNGRSIERWTYVGYRPIYYQTVGLGVGWGSGSGYGGRYCPPYHDTYWQGGATFDWVPYPISRVEFTNDRVSFWEYRRTRR